MSKAELLQEVAKLTPEERDELWEVMWRLEENTLPARPTEAEKKLLDRELEEYRRDGQPGRPWQEVESHFRHS